MARQKRKNPFRLFSFIFLILWRLGRRYPTTFLLVLLLGGIGYSYEVYYARPKMAYMGLPEAIDWKQLLTWTRIFRNDGFMVGYSDIRGNPLWVIYQLEPIPDNAPYYERPQQFYADWRNLTRIAPDSYSHSGYDRGHMAPNYAISRLYGRSAQLDTFLMTNITPQRPDLNRRLWQRLEEVEIDHFTAHFSTVWVLTGPIFDEDIERLESSYYQVGIPDAFYKIYIVPPTKARQNPKMLAFIVPQTVRGTEPLDRFLVTIDRVEKQTGLDFFHEIKDKVEMKLESSIEPEPWKLKTVAHLPPRY